MQRFSPKASSVLEKKIFKGFIIYGHGGHLGQRAATILAIFHSPNLRRLHIKFEQNWPRGSRGEVVWNSEHFSHTFFPYKCIRKQNWPYHKKVKCQFTTIILATLVDLLFPMIYVKVQPKRHPRFWRTRFLKVFPIQMHREANLTLVNGPRPF